MGKPVSFQVDWFKLPFFHGERYRFIKQIQPSQKDLFTALLLRAKGDEEEILQADNLLGVL